MRGGEKKPKTKMQRQALSRSNKKKKLNEEGGCGVGRSRTKGVVEGIARGKGVDVSKEKKVREERRSGPKPEGGKEKGASISRSKEEAIIRGRGGKNGGGGLAKGRGRHIAESKETVGGLRKAGREKYAA